MGPWVVRSPLPVIVPPVLEHRFNGTPFTVGIEEELMICDGESLDLAQGIEQILGALEGVEPREW